MRLMLHRGNTKQKHGCCRYGLPVQQGHGCDHVRPCRSTITTIVRFSQMIIMAVISLLLAVVLRRNDVTSFILPDHRRLTNHHRTQSASNNVNQNRLTMNGKRWNTMTLHLTMDSSSSAVRDDLTSSLKPLTTQNNFPFITPYQLLNPDSFPIPSTFDSTQQQLATFGGYDRVMSLNSVLSVMKECLQRIATMDSNNDPYDMERILNQATQVDGPSKDPESNQRVLRLEHQVYAPTADPLAWIRRQYSNIDDHESLFYLCTHEKDKEVAAIGSAILVNRTEDLWDRYYFDTSERRRTVLPTNAQWYGGARFDPSSSSSTSQQSENNKNEWSDFGAAHWMLPATELLLKRIPIVRNGESLSSSNVENEENAATTLVATFAIHLVVDKASNYSWKIAATSLLQLLDRIDTEYASKSPPTTLPPILERGNSRRRQQQNKQDLSTTRSTTTIASSRMEYQQDEQEFFEEAVAQALKRLQPHNTSVTTDDDSLIEALSSDPLSSNSSSCDILEKVVLARQQQIHFGAAFTALDVVRRWKYGGHEGGHLFYLRPQGAVSTKPAEFFGCTPERLFSVKGRSGFVKSEALAGTRPRGSTQKEDDTLLRDLYESPKDRRENLLTGSYIEKVFDELHENGLITKWDENITLPSTKENMIGDDGAFGEQPTTTSGFFVRRLLHLQHLCQRYSANLINKDDAMSVARVLLEKLNPTPAVCGVPKESALTFIRQYESIGFDRGYYSGPLGCIGYRESDILVALRCGLASNTPERTTIVSSYAGAGLVHGSTLHGEWAETNYKFSVISSLFPQSPISLQGAPTANVAWSAAFVAELIRNGVTRFYICPGSRSSPLVASITKAARSNVGVVHAISVHDERSAGFRAVGYSRGSGKVAAVVTSSGTAVANLYPAVVEAGMDGLPIVFLTADRPYESRGFGANQAIDQVKTFSDTYIRWFRDILPPSDDVPVSIGLSDAGHAVHLARELKGPVHINIQFRENLAPDAGPIRGDSRVDSLTRFNGKRFTDVPGYDRWSTMGNSWSKSYARSIKTGCDVAIRDVANLIAQSKRGIIVVGNLRPSVEGFSDQTIIEQSIMDFAKIIGFPIMAGVQGANIRFRSSAIVPFAEHLLRCNVVATNLQPDLILQIGAPLVSTAIPDVLLKASKTGRSLPYVLLHPHTPQERVDPSMLITHSIPAEIAPFLNRVLYELKSKDLVKDCGSKLAPLVLLGRMLQAEMKRIVFKATQQVVTSNEYEKSSSLSEPQVVVALSEAYLTQIVDRSLFLSNSMPIRDAEMFLYPYHDLTSTFATRGQLRIGSNRGASGIDGIISSALGYSESTASPTTLLIGDVAALHDIGSLHSVASSDIQQNQPTNKKRYPLTSVIVNNDGGSIFSFLPIAQHGSEVGFEEFFATPTRSFSFNKGAEAFGLSCSVANSYESFWRCYSETLEARQDTAIEARVLKRSDNVKVHKIISAEVENYVAGLLAMDSDDDTIGCLPVKIYGNRDSKESSPEEVKVMVLLHGWMGDKLEWHQAAIEMEENLGRSWKLVSIDLPGHGSSPLLRSSDLQQVKSSLQLIGSDESDYDEQKAGVESMARAVLNTLSVYLQINKVDALVGYSLGGRVALAMKSIRDAGNLINMDTSLILLGAFPGKAPQQSKDPSLTVNLEDNKRIRSDEDLAGKLSTLFDKVCLSSSISEAKLVMDEFLRRWYSQAIWTGLPNRELQYRAMIQKRSTHLIRRGRDHAFVLSSCSPPKADPFDWKHCTPENILFIAGELDTKYRNIGKMLQSMGFAQYEEISNSSHALLVESPIQVAEVVTSFLLRNCSFLSHMESLDTETSVDTISVENTFQSLVKLDYNNPLWATSVDGKTPIDSVDFESFDIQMIDEDLNTPIFGYGWDKDSMVDSSNWASRRQGLILQVTCYNGLMNGLGEISPLKGLHNETFSDIVSQISVFQKAVRDMKLENLPSFNAKRILSLDGSLGEMIDRLSTSVQIDRFLPSVRSGLEMALISLAAQQVSFPIHQALAIYTAGEDSRTESKFLPISGFISRKLPTVSLYSKALPSQWSFKSIKVKVGHQDLEQDRMAVLQGFKQLERHYSSRIDGKIRPDANRAWNASQYISFVTAIEGLDVNAMNKIEYIEEPLQKVLVSEWSLDDQIAALERSFFQSSIPYAIDESLSDVVLMNNGNFDSVQRILEYTFKDGPRGCAAVILKPTLLGYELSFRIAQYVRTKLGIGAVFSSSFDSGLGLAHTAFLSSVVDKIGDTVTYPHGIGTFTLLASDTITPSFGSYVNEVGQLNVPLLSRALFGLRLEEIRDSSSFTKQTKPRAAFIPKSSSIKSRNEVTDQAMYEASTSTSGSGNEISVAVSLPLPFSDEIAWLRFTDLPSMSRWSPWITSVRYQGMEETEWIINVRGISLKWRATSQLINDPFKGIQWQSVSGLRNSGIVEFIPNAEVNNGSSDTSTCTMNVRMAITPPQLFRPFLQGNIFLEDFLRDRLLKWSLEMFRDVVKADLALERGDVELGDALISSVEGKASAIEATLLSQSLPSPSILTSQERASNLETFDDAFE